MNRSNHNHQTLYTTSGDVGGFLVDSYILNSYGEWIGWVTHENQVYSVNGKYIGWLSGDLRILRKRLHEYSHPSRTPPPPPPSFTPPAQVPLPPMMAEIPVATIDVLDESPELLPTIDTFAFTDDVG